MRSWRPVLCIVTIAALAEAAEKPVVPAGVPVFRHHSIVLDYKDLKYNPCNDVIIPSVIRTSPLAGPGAEQGARAVPPSHVPRAPSPSPAPSPSSPLGRFYLYYAPHNAPGGICLAYADQLEGPWKEYEANPILRKDWPPHYSVSHVSGPEAIWNEHEQKLFLYYHGENGVTRLASSANGIDFQYEGAVVTTGMFDQVSEASYARVFRYTLPGRDNHYIMLLMGNHQNTRNIYLAWSNDGRKWEPRKTPLVTPPPGTSQVAQAWYFPWQGKHYLIYHAHEARDVTYVSLHVSEVDAAFEHTQYLGVFYDRTALAPDNVAQMSPCLVTEDGQRVEGILPSFDRADAGGTPATRKRLYLFTNVGPRLNQKIALAIADVPAEK